ncbi:polysaccharide deacetylase family protein [Pelagibius marinus]|uniref:polysaccharide deacetylase family protein n=1 Tax=Pelagibius marinus TaxID=2762760 RepID=UPI001872B5D5|nr:polysaccharide deacetylase family protein [Pelagibius marinus]
MRWNDKSQEARAQALRLTGALCLAAGLYLSAAPLAAQETPSQPTVAQPPSATQQMHAADNGAAVLMYHRFGEDSLPSTSVRLEQFEAHLAELTSGKYQVLALPEILARLNRGEALPEHAIAITIDDAALSVYREAWPRLKAAGLPVTIFVSTEPLDLGLPSYMSWAQLREMAADPLVTIGHHGDAHAHMAWLSPAEQRADLAEASRRFTAELNAVPQLFAYPYGEASLELRQNVIDAGFTAAFGQHSGALGEMSDRFTLPRFPLNEAYGDMERFRLVAGALPLPVDGITPADMSLREASQNPPNVGFTVVGAQGNLSGLNCFASAGEPQVMKLDQRIELRFDAPLPAGRVRINCTLRDDSGRWRWFGTQFVVAKEAVR